jgi:hypothetical protein
MTCVEMPSPVSGTPPQENDHGRCNPDVGTVDKVEGNRIKLTKKDSGPQVVEGTGRHEGHHHFISLGLVADIEDGKVRLSANADVAVTFEEEA